MFLNASAWLLPFVSEFSLIGDNISELVLGRLGFVQTIAFLIAGAGTLGLAYVIQQLTMPSWRSRIGSLLIALYGMGAIIVAIFPTDRVDSASDVWSQSTTGMIHVVAALISFLCVIAGMFLLTWAFFEQARWRRVTPWWTMLFPAAALPLFLGQGEGPLVGLSQRLLVAVVSAWLILVALRARSIIMSEETGTSSQEEVERRPA
ncbi:MAG: DUF998 domain-containing protein [Dehalococcoidia bacterium]